MSSYIMTTNDIIESREKHGVGNIMRRAQTQNAVRTIDGKHPTTYINMEFKNTEGKWIPAHYKWLNQVIAANAKPPSTEQNEPKFVNCTFRPINKEILSESQYKPEQYDSVIKQNQLHIKALDIIEEEFKLAIENDIYDKIKAKIPKREIKSFVQSVRDPTEEELTTDQAKPKSERIIINGKIRLANPMYRFRIPVDNKVEKDGKKLNLIGINAKGKHIDNVFDSKKSDAKRGIKGPARIIRIVKNNKEEVPLDSKNAGNFITYLSLLSGITEFSACISGQGVSMQPRNKETYVAHHPKITRKQFNDDEINNMGIGGVEYDPATVVEELDDNEEKTTKIKTKDKKKTKKHNNNGDDDDDDERVNDINDDSDIDSPRNKKKQTEKIKSSKKNSDDSDESPREKKNNKSSSAAKQKGSDDEPDEVDVINNEENLDEPDDTKKQEPIKEVEEIKENTPKADEPVKKPKTRKAKNQ